MSKTILFVEINPGMESSGAKALEYCKNNNITSYVLTSNKKFYDTPEGNPLNKANHVLEFSTSMNSREQCVNFLKDRFFKTKLDLVMSFSELYVELAAYIGKQLGISNNNYVPICKARNKFTWRSLLQNEHLTNVKSLLISNLEDLQNVPEKIGFPCIIKPIDGSASVSVQYCDNLDELKMAFNSWQNFHGFGRGLISKKEMIVETYVPGLLYSIECLNINGVNNYFGITNRKLSGAPYFVEVGANFPANDEISNITSVKNKTSKVINLLGFKNCALHIEFILGADNYIEYVDINPRLGGGLIPEMIESSLNISPIKYVLSTMLGDNTTINIPNEYLNYCASRYVVSSNWGKISHITGLNKIKKNKSIHSFSMSVKEGDVILPLKSNKNTLFEYFSTGTSMEKADNIANDVVNDISFDLKAELLV
ncbi:ATP-grasp domain-containing protein [Bombilactobacillus bombi]|uniref:ATP-grasp domain-containing protein n=1 Tax=Bombilactobacillus bombi TaxID=1303590 RepID=UPI0013C35E40|nr:ATP-grasp domain-containing protein [Bombilactobacillus bombi]